MRWSLVVPLLLVAGGPPSRSPDPEVCEKRQHPFLVPADSVHAFVKTIALHGTFSPLELGPELELRMLVIDTMIEASLRHHGYELVGASITDSVWAAAMDSVGPMFDAATGRRDSTKWRAAQANFRGALQEGYGVDAILYPSVRSAIANFSGKTAAWDGAKQSTTSFGSTFLDALGGTSYSGTIPALSLRVALFAADGRTLYDNFGGIQLVARVSHGKFSEVPDSLVLTSREQLVGAVRIALCQFLAAPPAH